MNGKTEKMHLDQLSLKNLRHLVQSTRDFLVLLPKIALGKETG